MKEQNNRFQRQVNKITIYYYSDDKKERTRKEIAVQMSNWKFAIDIDEDDLNSYNLQTLGF